MVFEGFPKDFFAFFRELKDHNERPWFEANKQRFRDSVQAPMSGFIAAMVIYRSGAIEAREQAVAAQQA